MQAASTHSAVVSWGQQIESDGFTIIPKVFSGPEVESLNEDLRQALAQPCEATSVRSDKGSVYAARNVVDLWPAAAHVWQRPPLPQLLEHILGPHYGLVRVLFFDKPPEQTWWLPWHKDMTIAVREHLRTAGRFCKPTRKAGVPHVEACRELLDAMLTVRIHLDDVTPANGPMRVISGSHATGKSLAWDDALGRSILVRRGDVLLFRPLLAHSSAASHPDNHAHRRILHLEFAGWPELPDGYAWHNFMPGASSL